MHKIQIVLIILALAAIPLFQNCGMDASTNTSSAFVFGESGEDCLSSVVDCGPKPEFLEITIDLSNPSSYSLSDTEFYLHGRCNSGNYPDHGIKVVAVCSGDSGNRLDIVYNALCVRGRYTKAVDISNFPNATACNVSVQMVGYTVDGSPVQNIQARGSANMDFSKQ